MPLGQVGCRHDGFPASLGNANALPCSTLELLTGQLLLTPMILAFPNTKAVWAQCVFLYPFPEFDSLWCFSFAASIPTPSPTNE